MLLRVGYGVIVVLYYSYIQSLNVLELVKSTNIND